MRSRIPLPEPESMSPEQRAIRDSILATRPSLDGPFLAWLHAPGLADPAQKVGAYCRYGTDLSLRESEMLILLTATRFGCEGEWDIHGPIAQRAGVDETELATIRSGGRPDGRDRRERLLFAFVHELLHANEVAEDTFAEARAELGIKTLVDIAGIAGYYSLVAMTLNAFDMRAS